MARLREPPGYEINAAVHSIGLLELCRKGLPLLVPIPEGDTPEPIPEDFPKDILLRKGCYTPLLRTRRQHSSVQPFPVASFASSQGGC